MKYILAVITAWMFLYSCLLAPIPHQEDPVSAPLGSVKPAGDLRSRIELSLTALTSDISSPEKLFIRDTTTEIAQRIGDALLGTTLLSASIQADEKTTEKIYSLLPANLNEKGYLGEILTDRADERQLAGNARLIRALCEYYRLKGESGALDMAQKICDSLIFPMLDFIDEYPAKYIPRVGIYFEQDTLNMQESSLPLLTKPDAFVTIGKWTLCTQYGEIFTAIDPLAQLYGYRKSSNTYEVLEKLVSQFGDVMEDFPGKGTNAYLSAVRGLLRYGEITVNNGMRQDAEKGWELFTQSSMTEMYGSGRTSPEGYGIVCPEDASNAYIVAMNLWAITGKGDYLQDAERIFYNSVAPSQRSDGRFTCLLSDTLDGKLSRYEGDAYGGTVAWVEALPAAAELSYFIRDNKILIPFYTESELTLEERGIKIVQHTGYPLDSTVRITVEEAPRRGIGLWLYFPSYMTAKSISRNGGQPLAGTVNNRGLLAMREVYRKGDVIEFEFRFGPKWIETASEDTADSDLYKASYGPLLLGYKLDKMLWLQRGVPLRGDEENFVLNREFTYTQDTLSGKVMVNQAPASIDLYRPPVFGPVYQPIKKYGTGDILPEYFLVRIGKE